jgi:FkbH-like protein
MQLSVNSCIDLRNFNSTKSMYTIDFFKNYVKYIIPIFQTAQGFVKKAIIFDCDNTLWGGVIGEDGIENIQLDETKKNGIYFKQVQLLAKQLLANGVVLGICSKNNFDDVIEVFEKSNTCTLKKDDFLIKKINWNDKSTNLKEISKELNIGIDSLIFVDDSEFEINLIKQQIPEIQTFIVPKNLSEYPIYFYNFIFSLFFNSSTKEDTIRLKSYHENLQRDSIKDNFSDIESYIKSLEIQIHLEIDKIENIERVAQLTQKTNQFNLTTKRYTTEQIKLLMSSKNSEIVTVNVIDKFGESGLTGVCILLIDVDTLTVEIDTLLLSCRILGRNIEIAFLEELISFYSQRGFKYIKSTFIKSPKNNQVENFFEKINFDLLNKNNLIKYYHFNLTNYIKSPITINYIKKEWKQE